MFNGLLTSMMSPEFNAKRGKKGTKKTHSVSKHREMKRQQTDAKRYQISEQVV
jgi:hypothetical protein